MTDREPENTIPEKDTSSLSHSRFFVLTLCFLAFFAVIVVRLVTIQVIDSSKYKTLARKQYERSFILPATRGDIFDRNGNVVVSNTMFISFAADPKIIGDNQERVAETFASIFGKPRSFYLDKLQETDQNQNNKRFVWLERRVKPEIARRIESAKLDGIVIINEPKRLYHYDELAGALLGFTDVDNKGISGIELQYDNEMKGVNGSVVMQRDGLGRVRPSADYPRREPVNGKDLSLTIDVTYQAIVDEELKHGVEANKADGGCALILNPKTGEVLALSMYPCINPNDAGTFNVAAARNRIVSDVFEPGSVFKVVTATAAYENNLVAPEMRFNAEHGKMKVSLGGNKFRLISDSHEFDILTFQEAIEMSSNIVLAKVGKLVGGEKLYRQARDFGFGMTTGIDLPGEVRGVLKKPSDHDWSGTTLQTMSYGYEIGATPLQIACAYAAVANKGILMKPFVIAKVQDADGKTMLEQKPQAIRRVMSQQTQSELISAFEGVVERGTGKEARINGVRIAGKTGTSRKYVNGRYVTNNYTASFVGFFPVEDPQVVCLVMMDNPKTRGYYGGSTSGPVFRSIAERVITTSYKFSRTAIAQEPALNGTVSVPDVRMLQPSLAKKMLTNYGLNCQTFGTGTMVIKQTPEPGKKIEKGETVSLILNGESLVSSDGMITVPDVRGMSIRRAMNRLVSDEFEIKVQGSGVVTQQIPSAGERARSGSSILLLCSPRSVLQATLF
ncbi:MAG: penicillin-binding transpeptidase domain-containing protein [Ignavibacteriales bacterium]|nr:penicillin-binding transpeptidase domain-containing protein [Ignavibacteriales bacterium]